ncbi:MAG: universal stress protein [Chloroflexi bacterium]|nr:universal stress protein [Chloroflexota bacterium]
MTASAPILVPLDGSKDAEKAVPAAIRLARALEAPLRFVHVADEAEGIKSAADVESATRAFDTYARDLAKNQGAGAIEQSTVLQRGAPARVILDLAESARMVVMSTHGRGGFKAAVIGSVADKVIRGTPVPALLVRAIGTAAELKDGPVLVALDGSELAEKGLALGRDLAAKLGLTVALVRSFTALPPVGVEFSYYSPELLEGMEEGVKQYLAATARAGERTVAIQGAAGTAVTQVAKEVGASLVVMTTHGRGFAARLALGSTTGRVIHDIDRPLLVVPAGD